MLVQAANGAILTKGSWYRAKHNKLRFQLGSYNKATVAIANHIARALYHIISNVDERYCDLGENRADPKQNQVSRLVRKLEVMGYDVKLLEKQA